MASGFEQALIARLESLAAPILDSMGLELVDLEFIPRKQVSQVRVTLDRKNRKERGSVGLEEISGFNRAYSAVLDVEDPIERAYELEVTSPGLTRELKKPRDFRWAEGRLISAVTRPPHEKPGKYTGRLLGVSEDGIVLGLEKKRPKGAAGPAEIETEMTMTYDGIARANLEIEWKD